MTPPVAKGPAKIKPGLRAGKRRVTINDVAREAGVSIAAVSRILNNSYDGFSAREETKQRVYDAVRKLGYKASRAAVRLATGRHQALALCYPEPVETMSSNNPSSLGVLFGQLGQMLQVHGAARAAAAANHDLVLMMRGKDRPLTDLLSQAAESVDGIIYVQPEDDKELIARLTRSEVPIAVVGQTAIDLPGVCQVRVDEFTAGRMAMGHLIVAGARRVAVVVPDEQARETAIVARLEGVRTAVKTYSDPTLGFDVVRLPYDLDLARTTFLSHIGQWGRPDGVLTLGGVLPFAIMKALEEQRLSVPDDVKVVGFDENPMYQLHNPPITGIRYPIEEMARRASELLLDRIRTGETPNPVVMTPKMIARRSSEAPAGALF